MKTIQNFNDKLAISLSLLCAMHCLALPLLLALIPSMSVLGLDNEAFHYWMLVAVIPISIYALTMGCKQHKRYPLLILGFTGLTLLVLAVTIGESLLGEYGEKGLTLAGAVVVACGHYINYRLCRSHSCNHCDD